MTPVDLVEKPAPPGPAPATAPPVERGTRAPKPRDLWSTVGKVAVGALILAAAVVHAWGMWDFPIRVDDEGTYVSQAWAIESGVGLAHYTYWYDHPPAGWMQIAGWTAFTDAFDRSPNGVGAGREAMLVAKVVSCALLYVLARRLQLRRPAALVAVALLAFSPLALEMQRRVFLDNVATPWLLGAFVLALSPQRRIDAVAAGAFCFAIAVLSKETVLLLFPAFLLQVWLHGDPRNRKFAVGMAFTVSALIVSAYPLFALLQGEFLPGDDHVSLIASAQWQLFERPGSGSLFDPTSGVRGLIGHWADIDPWLAAAGVVCTPIALFVRRFRAVALAMAIQILVLARGGYVPYMYVVAALPFAALLVAGLGDQLWDLRARSRFPELVRRAWLPARVALVAIVALAVMHVAPMWAGRVEAAMTVDRDAPMESAQLWVEENVPKDAILVVDDAIWLDLVRDGRPRDRVIWFYKLDLDPAVQLPGGWRSIDYLVLTAVQYAQFDGMPRLRTAVENSTVAAQFGEAADQVTVYKVEK